jgi:hypothetical protein
VKPRTSIALETFNAIGIVVLFILFIRGVIRGDPNYVTLAVAISLAFFWVLRRFGKA